MRASCELKVQARRLWSGGVVFLVAVAVSVPWISAQVAIPVTPTTPTKFDTRGVGQVTQGGVTATVSRNEPPPPQVRQVTHFSLCAPRQWTSNDGKSLLGTAIAFEDSVISVKSVTESVTPPLPAHPTVVRAGKVRLLVNGQLYEVPLERLSEADRKFVEGLQIAVAQGAAQSASKQASPPAKASGP